ncbi:Cytochrome P450 1A1 [Sarcoptes scabiei]|uniref:Cytochrome P450 1A1 n=1 Tax=Sarcoptes scabiei TaxID=52283 RepID=A0A834VAD0_SARSC|nr:Cytochrome P450 1A1 [Sarcoptes scabiei]
MFWSLTTYLTNNLSSFVLMICLFRYLVLNKRDKRLPKGPMGIPLFGYLPFLGSNPFVTLWKLQKQFGPIYTIQLGEKSVVVLNDWESVRNALRKDSFLGRPFITSFSLWNGIKSLIDENDIGCWREERRFFENFFRTNFDSTCNNLKNLSTDLRSLVLSLKRSAENLKIDIRKEIERYSNHFLFMLIFNRHHHSQRFNLIDSAILLRTILSFYPIWMAKTISKLIDLFNHSNLASFAKFFRNEVKIHSRSIENELSIRDLIDYYILEVHLKQDAAILMSIDKLRANCHVFLSFGNEAFLSSLEWSLILIARFSNHQQSIYDEIMKVIGVKRIPAFKDEHRMPFTVAFINEVLRWRTVLPLNLIRRAIDDTSIMGHFIPKDTLVLANIWAVHHDSKIWDNPSKFNPYRFLTEDGKTLIDHEGFIPFSLGKRSCVAESFVRKWLFIFVVTIVQNFHIKSPNHREEIFDEKFSLTLRPKQNTNLIFHAREERFKEK